MIKFTVVAKGVFFLMTRLLGATVVLQKIYAFRVKLLGIYLLSNCNCGKSTVELIKVVSKGYLPTLRGHENRDSRSRSASPAKLQ